MCCYYFVFLVLDKYSEKVKNLSFHSETTEYFRFPLISPKHYELFGSLPTLQRAEKTTTPTSLSMFM